MIIFIIFKKKYAKNLESIWEEPILKYLSYLSLQTNNLLKYNILTSIE